MDKNIIRECNVAKDGVCAMHGVEVERRRHSEKLTDKIPFLLSAINKIIGFSVLMSLVISGGFVYIRDVKQQVEYYQQTAKIDHTGLGKEISALSTVSVRMEEKYIAVLRELETLNKQMTALLAQQDGGKR